MGNPSAPASPILIGAAEMRSFLMRAGAVVGIEGRDLELFVEGLVEADLRGIDTHGIMRVAPYMRGFATGELNPRPRIAPLRRRGATAVLDGDNGLGVITGHHAMALAMELAGEHGIGMVTMRNSNHSGMLAQFVTAPIARDMIGHFVSNGPAAMAPWGGIDQALSNNPVAWGIPTGTVPPIILDMACSAAARGKIRLAATKGERIPLGWATDSEGRPTDDPAVAMTGLIQPVGAHKGSGLAIVHEVLCAVLPGATLSIDTSRKFLEQGARVFDSWRIGHMAMAIDVACFEDVPVFKARLDDLVRRWISGRQAAWCDRILMPGEPEALCRAARLQHGIPVSRGVVDAANEAAREFGIPPLA